MSTLTVAQVAEFLIKLVGACLIIVGLSFPIQSAARYIQGEANHAKTQAQFDNTVQKAETWVPAPLARLLGTNKPANGLIPPPPPMAF
jgi:hypothetical protein